MVVLCITDGDGMVFRLFTIYLLIQMDLDSLLNTPYIYNH